MGLLAIPGQRARMGPEVTERHPTNSWRDRKALLQYDGHNRSAGDLRKRARWRRVRRFTRRLLS